jgi:phospholipase/lecithinase/hemolysin
MNRHCARYITLVVALLILVAPGLSASGAYKIRLIFFGDSLSDSGNHFIEFHEVSRQPFEPIPDAPYLVGGLHFTNGATWAEQLARLLRSPLSGLPSSLAPRIFTNYAVGRARARPAAPVFPYFDLNTQVGRFLYDFDFIAPSDATYAIWIGANDLNDALNALAVDPSGSTSLAILGTAVQSVGEGIQTLWLSGARRFLVLNVPNLALTPAVRAAGPGAQAAATFLTQSYNTGLGQSLDALGALPGIGILRLDADALVTMVVANPTAVGLTNVMDPCLTFGVVAGAFCAGPNRYLFWDATHPTRAGHGLVAGAAADVLAE